LIITAYLHYRIGNMNTSIDPSLTVVIPVTRMAFRLQNLETTLVQCIENSVNVILIHDIQDKHTGLELRNLLAKISGSKPGSITYIEQYCGSPGEARNIGKNLVSTEWIAFWDSDDIAIVSKFLLMIEEANKRGDQLVVGGYRVLDSDSKSQISISKFSDEDSKQDFEIFLNPGMWRWGFRNDLIKKISFQDFKMGEDQVFLLDSSVFDHRIYHHPDVVYDYFINSNLQSINTAESFEKFSTTTSYIFTSFERKSVIMKKFATVVLFRLLFTGIKRCNFIDKIKLVLQFLSQVQVLKFYNAQRIGFALKLIANDYLKKTSK
jgi:glycosyltransferase involved in cell wall biosynthesis